LMQIRYETARGMGYTGSASGLLDANTNLTYAVPYLANAYKVAGGDHARAVSLYAGGYYYVAKRKGLLRELRTSASAPVSTEAAQSSSNPVQAAVFTPAESR
jgi:soluble lytic murein transglycosylase-like protein